MKRIIASCICLLLLLASTSALAATVVATDDVYLRTGPGRDYAQLTILEGGDSATYLGSLATDERGVTWYKVYYHGYTGWVSSTYSTLNTWAWDYGYVTATASVKIRSGPGLGYAELGAIEAGDTLEYRNETSVDDRGVAWYKVSYGTYTTAWISSKYAKLSSDSSSSSAPSAPSTPSKPSTSASGKYVTATGGSVNVRSGAGQAYSLLTTMRKGDTATYLGASSVDWRGVAWYKVNYGGVVGWVSSALTQLSGGSSSSSSSSWSFGTATTTANAWLREGPGLSYDKITEIFEGSSGSYLGNTSVDDRGVTWYKVEFSGKTGWMSSRFVKIH